MPTLSKVETAYANTSEGSSSDMERTVHADTSEGYSSDMEKSAHDYSSEGSSSDMERTVHADTSDGSSSNMERTAYADIAEEPILDATNWHSPSMLKDRNSRRDDQTMATTNCVILKL